MLSSLLYNSALAFLLLISQQAFCQLSTANPEKLSIHVSDSERVELYLHASDGQAQNNTDSALALAKQALLLSRQSNYKTGICRAALKTGIILQNNGNYNGANAYFFEGLKLAEKLKSPYLEAQAYNAIANSFSFQKQHDVALNYYQKAVTLFTQNGAHKKTGVVLMNMAGEYYMKEFGPGHFNKTYSYYLRAIDSTAKYGDYENLISCYSNISIPYSDEGLYDKALYYLQKAINLSDSTGYDQNLISLYYSMARTYSYLKQYRLSHDYSQKSIALSKAAGDFDYLSENYLAIAETYKDEGRFSEAYDYMTRHKNISDSLLNAGTLRQLNELKTIYETGKKEEHIRQLKAESEFEKKSKLFIIISSALLFIILALIINRLVYKKRKLAELHEKEQNMAAIKQELTESKLLITEQQLEAQQAELMQYAQNLIKKNDFIEQLQQKIGSPGNDIVTENRQATLQELVETVILTDEDWENFKELFNKVHSGFFIRLKEKIQDLTQAEIRLCALTRLKLSSKEMAQLLGISSSSVNTTRYRLRKKLNMGESESFEEMVLAI